MWEVNPTFVSKMLERIEPIKTDAVLRDVLKEDYKVDLPIEGGWGYSQSTSIKFLKQETRYDFVSLEYQIAQWLLFEELIIFRERDDLHSGIEKKLKQQKMFEENGRRYDVLEFEVTCWHDFYWEKLKTEWDEAKANSSIDPSFLKDHEKKRNEAMLRFNRTYYFEITDVFCI